MLRLVHLLAQFMTFRGARQNRHIEGTHRKWYHSHVMSLLYELQIRLVAHTIESEC